MTNHRIEVPSDLLVFYEELADLQDRLLQSLPREEAAVNEEQIHGFLQQQRFWLQVLPFPLNPARFMEDFRAVSEFVVEKRPQTKESIAMLNELVGSLNLEEIAQKALWLDLDYLYLAVEGSEASSELFLFLVENAIRPQLRAWSEKLPELKEKDHWNQSYCPVCGQNAIISRLRPGDGQRSMFCGHCFTEWEYRHMICPYCNNDDHQTIDILSIEDDRFDLIYTCGKCKGYIKTLNERQGGKAGNLFVEGARTFFLDLLAEREGYHNQQSKRDSLN